MAFTELKNARQFCDVLRKAADAAMGEGRITRREHRLLRLFSVLRPRKTADVMEFIKDQAVAAGKVSAAEGVEEIDWDALLEFIRELLPIILEFIQMILLLF